MESIFSFLERKLPEWVETKELNKKQLERLSAIIEGLINA